MNAVSSFLSISKAITGLLDLILKYEGDKSARLATYLESLSYCLSDIATKFESDDRPYDTCAQLRIHLRNVVQTLKEFQLDDTQITTLYNQIQVASGRRINLLDILAETRNPTIWLIDTGARGGDKAARERSWGDGSAEERPSKESRQVRDDAIPMIKEAAGELMEAAAEIRARR